MNNDIRCDSLWQYDNDSSNFASEGMGIFEYLQFLRNKKVEQEEIEKRLAGSTTEVPGKN